jgi:hypothetical protein
MRDVCWARGFSPLLSSVSLFFPLLTGLDPSNTKI